MIPSSGPWPKWRTTALALALAALAALPYLVADGVSPNFIHLDDDQYVLSNPNIAQGLSLAGARWALTTFYVSNWHPLTWLSHMLDISLFGLDARGHHATSILLHGLNAALLFLVLRRLTGSTGRSALVAALFGVHPLHVESVAWIAERKDVLAGLLFMLVLLAYERYCRRGGTWRYLGALALFALGLTAKPMLVTLPFLLLLLDFWPLGRIRFGRGGTGTRSGRGAILLEKAPFILLAAASGVLTFLAQREGGAVGSFQALPAGARLANAVVSYAAYLRSAVWPARLAVFYPHPVETISWPGVAAAAILLALLSAAALGLAGKRPFLVVGWCWFLGMLVPVIGLVQIGAQARADRYTYLPLIGLCLALVWLAAERTPPPASTTVAGAAAALVAALVAVAAAQVGFWKDSETLFRRTLAVTSDNWVIRTNLAGVLEAAGRHEEAAEEAREAIRIRPNYSNAQANLGASLSGNDVAHYNLGYSLAALGRHEEAIAGYREALRIRPDYAKASVMLGNSLAALGRVEEAIAGYREALRANPDLAEAWLNLGILLAARGRTAEAEESLREALRVRPGYPAARDALNRIRPGEPRR